jgi:hypothetical protein
MQFLYVFGLKSLPFLPQNTACGRSMALGAAALSGAAEAP